MTHKLARDDKIYTFVLIFAVLLTSTPIVHAHDATDFYQEEEKVVSASLQPQSANQTPATVFVVTQEEIHDSGALSIPDALRGVPGVQVNYTTTGQQEVGIRGLNRPLNNRVLVMLDGKSIQNGYFNYVTWESIPVELDGIDRIEVVEGPASAVYGADALSGVINIITKKPEQLQGGKVTYAGGERNTELGSLTFGRKDGKLAYRIGGGWHSTNRFENASALGTEAGKFNGLVSYDFSDHSSLSLSGGVDNYNTQTSFGILGPSNDKGLSSFTRTDYNYRETNARFYWDHLRSVPGENALDVNRIESDSYDFQAMQGVDLPFRNHLVIGGNYHKNTARSSVLNNGNFIQQDLWSFFGENKWDITDRWMLMASGRVDRHPLTPIRFSPRGSLLYTPEKDQVFRVSAGTSYRNPTLLENYLNVSPQVLFSPPVPVGQSPFPPFGLLVATSGVNNIQGARNLDPETMQEQEVSYNGVWGRFKTVVTGFHYTFAHSIDVSPFQVTGYAPPAGPLFQSATLTNYDDAVVRTWGAELDTEYIVTHWLRLFANYTYQYAHEAQTPAQEVKETPRHQTRIGLNGKEGGWTSQWSLDWVDATNWDAREQTLTSATTVLVAAPLPAYFLLSAHVGYEFSGRLQGVSVAVNAFNLLNHDHYEMNPSIENTQIVKSRITGTVSYKF